MASPFIILFTARSGSTALYGNLKSLPNVTMRAEVFGNKVLPGEMEQTDDNRIKFLRRYWAPYKPGAVPRTDIFKGFKFQVTTNNAQFERPARLAKVASEYEPRVIVLRRQNILKQAISSINAKRLMALSKQIRQDRGSSHVLPEESGMIDELRKTPMVIDFTELKEKLSSIKAAYAKLDRLAGSFGQVPHEITYEDYLENRDAVVRGVLDHIGIDPDSYQPSDAYLKITSDRLEDVVGNYAGLKRFVDGTPYAGML